MLYPSRKISNAKPRDHLPDRFRTELIEFAELNTIALEMPRWTQSGIILKLFALFLLVFVLPLFVPWRVTMAVPLTIVGGEPPRSVRVTADGPLTSVLVAGGDNVSSGDVIGRMGRASDHEDVDKISKELNSFINLTEITPNSINLSSISVGGQVQEAHESLTAAIDDLANHIKHGNSKVRLAGLYSQLNSLQRELVIQKDQLALVAQTVALAEEKLERHEEGAKRGWVSKNLLGAVRIELIERKLALEQVRNSVAESTSKIEQARTEIVSLQKGEAGNSELLRSRVHQRAVRLSGAISSWRSAHELTAPIDGVVKFPEGMRIGQHLKVDDEFAVVAPVAKSIIGVGLASDQAKGVIAQGASVIISVPGFPTSSYGHLEGTVTHTSDVSVDGNYEIVVHLKSGIRSTMGFKMPIRNRSKVQALVVTRETTLGQAIVENFFGRLNF